MREYEDAMMDQGRHVQVHDESTKEIRKDD
jgi:hypothetical protein